MYTQSVQPALGANHASHWCWLHALTLFYISRRAGTSSSGPTHYPKKLLQSSYSYITQLPCWSYCRLSLLLPAAVPPAASASPPLLLSAKSTDLRPSLTRFIDCSCAVSEARMLSNEGRCNQSRWRHCLIRSCGSKEGCHWAMRPVLSLWYPLPSFSPLVPTMLRCGAPNNRPLLSGRLQNNRQRMAFPQSYGHCKHPPALPSRCKPLRSPCARVLVPSCGTLCGPTCTALHSMLLLLGPSTGR